MAVLAIAGRMTSRAVAQGTVADDYLAVAHWLFQRYLERGVATTLGNVAADKPAAQATLMAVAPRMVGVLAIHRDPFAAAMEPALRTAFDDPSIAALAGLVRRVPLALDADNGRRLIAADAEFRRNGQQVMSAIASDIDLLIGQVLAAGAR